MTKIRPINQTDTLLIRLAKKANKKAQLSIYDKYSAKMLAVCRQYIKDLHFAEDVMITAFHKVFLNIESYQPYGSFEAWIRQIMVRECISYLRIQKNKFNVVEIEDNHFLQHEQQDFTNKDRIQLAIDNLPIGCKTVFNLYAIEGYKHQEIAEMLNISLGTSKSQLSHARKLLQSQLEKFNTSNNGTE